MDKAYYTQCNICSKEFKALKGKSNKFCSIDCYRVLQRRGDYKTGHKETTFRTPCSYCKKEVIGHLSKCRNGKTSNKLFCNRSCYDAFRKNITATNITTCDMCGKACNKSKTKKSYCSSDCYNLQRKAKPKCCVNCKCLFTPVKLHTTGRLISHNAGKTCSANCQFEWNSNNEQRKQKISFAFSGSKHPNWLGGSHRMASRGTGWVKLRELIKARDNYICKHCGMTEAQSLQIYKCKLHVNHIKPFHQFGGRTQLANKQSNLESLCCSCHTIADAKWRKENSVQYSLSEMFAR